MQYSEPEVQDCATRLYALAELIIRQATTQFGLIGLVLAGGAGGMIGGLIGGAARSGSGALMMGSIVGLIGAGLGWYFGAAYGREVGRQRSLDVRLKAQNSLALLEMHRQACGAGSGLPVPQTFVAPVGLVAPPITTFAGPATSMQGEEVEISFDR